MIADHPKSLRDPANLAARRELLAGPHLVPLRRLARRISAERGAPVPEPDPLDGGVDARLLLMLETPGPRGTGFVSRDNPTGTAANLFRFFREAGIARAETVIWNAVPWVIHAPGARNRAPRRAEILAAAPYLEPLLDCLPHLSVVVLAGRVAALSRSALTSLRPDVLVIAVPHPSPTYVCASPSASVPGSPKRPPSYPDATLRSGSTHGQDRPIAGNCAPMPLNAGHGPRSGTSPGHPCRRRG